MRLNESSLSLSVTTEEYLRIIQNNKKSNQVILQKESGETVIWRPDKVGGTSGKVELFNEKNREFAVGETVLFHRSNKVQHITKGERITKPMMGFKGFHSAGATLAGIELYRMLKKSQHINSNNSTAFEQFYALACIVAPKEKCILNFYKQN
ncbi:MAG: hypothetical protein KIT56_06825 [Gammaproteobacteria bacterium]|nr:hypothetical protein [Gammaproteobacteria bacterium]MCW5583580.1 hypothetical protein [Gammaproteobacteria bacterium]